MSVAIRTVYMWIAKTECDIFFLVLPEHIIVFSRLLAFCLVWS